jgi:hypothetical protein
MHIPDTYLIQLLQSQSLVRFENLLQSSAPLSGKRVDCKTALKWLFATAAQRLRIDANATEIVVTFSHKCKGGAKEVYICEFYLY